MEENVLNTGLKKKKKSCGPCPLIIQLFISLRPFNRQILKQHPCMLYVQLPNINFPLFTRRKIDTLDTD